MPPSGQSRGEILCLGLSLCPRDQGFSEEEDDVRCGLPACPEYLPVHPPSLNCTHRNPESMHLCTHFQKTDLRIREIEGLAQDHVAGTSNSPASTPEAGSFWTWGPVCPPAAEGRGQGAGQESVQAQRGPSGQVCGHPLCPACDFPGRGSSQKGTSWRRGRVFLRPASLLPEPLSPSCYLD